MRTEDSLDDLVACKLSVRGTGAVLVENITLPKKK